MKRSHPFARVALAVAGLFALAGCAPVALDAPPPAAAAASTGAPARLVALAKGGDAEAQVTLGWMYEIGRGVARDPARAAEWYRRAAAQGDPLAEYALAELYVRGLGVPRDEAAAAALYRAAAEAGNASAQYKLGALYETGRGVPRDYRRAAAWYARAGKTWAGSGDAPPGVERVTGPLPAGPALAPPGNAAAASAGKSKETAKAATAENEGKEPRAGAAAALALLPEPSGRETAKKREKAVASSGPEKATGAGAPAWRVHLASFRGARGADRAEAEIKAAAGDLIGAHRFARQRVDLGPELGTWIRVTLGPFADRAQARAFCQGFAARGLYCRPLPPVR